MSRRKGRALRNELKQERFERRFNERQQARFVARGRLVSARLSMLLQDSHTAADESVANDRPTANEGGDPPK